MRDLPDTRILHPSPAVAVVEFDGEYDLASREAVSGLLEDLVEHHDHVVADVTRAIFVDASFLNNLLSADRLARREAKRFTLQFGTAPVVRSALQHSGVLEILDHVRTREDALAPPESPR